MISLNVFFGELGLNKVEQEEGYSLPSAFGKFRRLPGTLCSFCSLSTESVAVKSTVCVVLFFPNQLRSAVTWVCVLEPAFSPCLSSGN